MPDLYRADENQSGKTESVTKRTKNRALSAFCYKPKNAHFETQDQGEEVILLLRRHPITNLPWIFLSIAMFAAPFFFHLLPFYTEMPARFEVATAVLWYLLTIAIFLQGALTWFFNVNIVTNQRVVDVDFNTLIYKEISDAQITKIQEVTYRVGGFAGTFFNYGSVLIQTAGAIPNFEFEDIPNPGRVANLLEDLQNGEQGGSV